MFSEQKDQTQHLDDNFQDKLDQAVAFTMDYPSPSSNRLPFRPGVRRWEGGGFVFYKTGERWTYWLLSREGLALSWRKMLCLFMSMNLGWWNKTYKCPEIFELSMHQIISISWYSKPLIAWLLPLCDPILVIWILLLPAPCLIQFLKQQTSNIAKVTTTRFCFNTRCWWHCYFIKQKRRPVECNVKRCGKEGQGSFDPTNLEREDTKS